MKILVTGSTGMVGSNFLEHEASRKFEILSPKSKDLDLLNLSQVESYLSDNRPDLVVHCAGIVGGIQANIREPFKFLAENSQMGLNLVLACKQAKVKRVINLGSSCMYPRDYKNPLKEEYILKAELEPTNEGYALAKILTAKLCEYLSRECPELLYKTLIPCNLYGRWDKFGTENSHMIPAVIRKVHQAKVNSDSSVEIWGDGSARREFMYVADLIDLIYFSIDRIDRFDQLPSCTNVGIDQDFSINEYYQAIKKIVGYEGEFHHDLSKPIGMRQKLMDSSRARALGWKPRYSLDEGLAKTYDFYLNEVLKND